MTSIGKEEITVLTEIDFDNFIYLDEYADNSDFITCYLRTLNNI